MKYLSGFFIIILIFIILNVATLVVLSGSFFL